MLEEINNDLKWADNGIFICEKCGAKALKIYPSETEKYNVAHLKDWLKDKLKDEKLWGPTRVMLTSCMDVCPKGKVTVQFAAKGKAPQTFIFDPVEDKHELLEMILDKAKKL